MDQLFGQPWAAWALGVALGLPLLLIVLGELNQRLAVRNSPFVRPLRVCRIAVLPLGAALLLLRRGAETPDNLALRLLETCFTVAAVAVVLLLIDAAVDRLAGQGSNKERIPGIFV